MSDQYTKLIAKLIADIPPDTILLTVVLLIITVLLVGFRHLVRVVSFSKRLESEVQRIDNAKILDFTLTIKSLPEIEDLIREFEELMPGESTNTQNCENILSEDNIFRSIHVDEAALEHYPGILTALGIAGTFIGILYVLVPLQREGIIASQNLLENLLRGAGIAFITSIFGIASSLIFTMFERKIIGDFKKCLYDFQMSINTRLSRITPEELLLDVKDAMETMADDIGAAVSKNIVEAVNSVEQALKATVSAAGNSTQEIVSGVMGSIESTLEKFSANMEQMEKSSSIQSGILEQFDKSVQNAAVLAEKLEKIIPSISEVAKDFVASSERIEKLPDALLEFAKRQEKLTEGIRESNELMKENWQAERERITALTEELQKQFSIFEEGIASGLQSTMSKFDDELSRAGTYVATWLDRLDEDIKNFTSKVSTFNDVVQNGSSELQDAMQGLSEVLSKQADNLKIHTVSISSSLKEGFKEIELEIKKLPPEIQKAISGIEGIYRNATELLPKMLGEQIKTLVDEINAQGKKTFLGFRRK